MSRFFPNAKRSLTSLLNLITHLVADGLLLFRLMFRSRKALKRGGPVPAKTAGLLSGVAGPFETMERLRSFLSRPLVSPTQLEKCLGHRQTRDADRRAAQGFPVVLEMEVQGGRPRPPEGIRQLIVQMAQAGMVTDAALSSTTTVPQLISRIMINLPRNPTRLK